ncbi:hypothetical protein ILUMI_15451 [Ignelater luminosus]|uniref:Uncharacterized protein n=1 Tax=Ignelater luminosus TaxID=2038154 RepID=A0A8K0CUP2_IGNLU|nr:hypothetical protein ILUMI_15451 [Ignelater luminosus]
MDFTETACVVALLLRMKAKKRYKKQYWVHPVISQRLMKGQFCKIHNDLRDHPNKFFQYYRMSMRSFDDLLQIIGPRITYQDTKWRNFIPPEERLLATLRCPGGCIGRFENANWEGGWYPVECDKTMLVRFGGRW